MKKYLKTRRCKFCGKLGTVYFLKKSKFNGRFYVCDDCKDCFHEVKKCQKD